LPAEQVVWFVVGMALMRNESIDRALSSSLRIAYRREKGRRSAQDECARESTGCSMSLPIDESNARQCDG
jgi:hypothetical protein